MASPNESVLLSAAESADLSARVERFRNVWAPDGSTDLATVLPPPGAPHRLAVLVQLILLDMERRGAARLPFRVERYVNMFPDDLSSNTVPALLLVAEYRLRHQYTDRPDLSEYQRWFPDQYPAIAEALRNEPLATGFVQRTTATPIEPVQYSALDATRSGPKSVPPGLSPIRPDGESLPNDGPYPYVRKLGAGAFGTVYEARAPGDIPVALKRIMRPSHDRANQEERRALEAIKGLSHPFLLKTHAYWIHEDRIVIAMELADGSLSDRIEHHQKEGRTGVPPEELIPIFEQAAQGLDYLHSEKISHRDIKPENILLSKGFAKVADFGLARSQQNTMTRVNDTAGTPAYMAPEMWRQQVGLHGSDQYALAATYVRARLGRMLFKATSLVDMGNAHINEKPDLNPLPAPEQRVLLKALAKSPSQRYESCCAFVQALREAVFPPPKPVVTNGGGNGGIKPILLTAVAVAVAVAGAVAVVMMTMGPRNDQTKQPDPPPVTPKEEPKPLPLVSFDGWNAGPGEPKTIGEKRYPPTFTREEAGETLTAILVEQTPGGSPDQPSAFYMLKHKLSNRVFAKLWEDVKDDTRTDWHKLGLIRATFAPEAWKKGVIEDAPTDKKRPTVRQEVAERPALGVTFPEATLVARKLGGSLPTFQQWLKAVGTLEPKPQLSIKDPPADTLPPDEARKAYAKAEIPLGLDKPETVTYGKDECYCGVKQLLSNGFEWLCHPATDAAARITLFPAPSATRVAGYVSQGYTETHVSSIKELDAQTATIATTNPPIGVRVVLNP